MTFDPFKDSFSDVADIEAQHGEKGALDGARVLYAVYVSEGYEGSACVIFERDGKLFENESSHCSCNGLDWEPGEVTRESLRRYNRGSKSTYSGGRRDYPQWDEFIASLEETS